MLANVFQHRVGIGVGECNCTPIDPNCSDFIERIYGQLHDAISTLAVSMDDASAANMATVKSALFDSDTPVGQEMHNLLDTICHWVCDCLKSKNFVNVFDFAKFFPLVSFILTVSFS